MHTAKILVAGVVLAGAAAGKDANPAGPDVPALTDESFVRWLDFVRPADAEQDWQAIPWRPTFWDAVVEAHAAGKPVLLWAMNGHPLACT